MCYCSTKKNEITNGTPTSLRPQANRFLPCCHFRLYLRFIFHFGLFIASLFAFCSLKRTPTTIYCRQYVVCVEDRETRWEAATDVIDKQHDEHDVVHNMLKVKCGNAKWNLMTLHFFSLLCCCRFCFNFNSTLDVDRRQISLLSSFLYDFHTPQLSSLDINRWKMGI